MKSLEYNELIPKKEYFCRNLKYMRKIISLLSLSIFSFSFGQSTVKTINAGSVVAGNGMISVGEIFIPTQNQVANGTGILAIVSQVNQNLTVDSYAVSEGITVFPNPTVSTLHFSTKTDLFGEKVAIFDMSGKMIRQQTIESNNSIDLSTLTVGTYLLQFENKNYNSFKIIKN